MMPENSNNTNLAVAAAFFVGGAGGTGITSAVHSGGDLPETTVSIHQCQPYIDHARSHMFMENELKHLTRGGKDGQ